MTPLPSEAIAVSRLEKRFGDFIAVDQITFRVKKGEIFGFLGERIRKVHHHPHAVRHHLADRRRRHCGGF